MPIHQNVLYQNTDESKKCAVTDLHFMICEKCGFVFNALYTPDDLLYDDSHDNRQSASSDFSAYMDSSIQYLESKYTSNPNSVIEIGCGCTAEYLQRIHLRHPEAYVCGYDPACKVSLEGIETHQSCFNYDKRLPHADWIISRHVIEHLSDPCAMMKSVDFLKEGKSVFFIETPDVRWIFQNFVIFDFFYEHCSLFSPITFYYMAKQTDTTIVEWKSAFQGQYQWVFVKRKEDDGENININYDTAIKEILNLSVLYKEEERNILKRLQRYVDMNAGNIAIWGAGAKGNTFCNMFDKKAEKIIMVIDTNLDKVGKYVAVTGHKVVPPEEALADDRVKHIIVMNPNYEREIKAQWNLKGKNVVTQDVICANVK